MRKTRLPEDGQPGKDGDLDKKIEELRQAHSTAIPRLKRVIALTIAGVLGYGICQLQHSGNQQGQQGIAPMNGNQNPGRKQMAKRDGILAPDAMPDERKLNEDMLKKIGTLLNGIENDLDRLENMLADPTLELTDATDIHYQSTAWLFAFQYVSKDGQALPHEDIRKDMVMQRYFMAKAGQLSILPGMGEHMPKVWHEKLAAFGPRTQKISAESGKRMEQLKQRP